MDKQQLEQQIDQFINNEMSPAEQQSFCQKLETDKELKIMGDSSRTRAVGFTQTSGKCMLIAFFIPCHFG